MSRTEHDSGSSGSSSASVAAMYADVTYAFASQLSTM
jgi:hypothetical protein